MAGNVNIKDVRDHLKKITCVIFEKKKFLKINFMSYLRVQLVLSDRKVCRIFLAIYEKMAF